MKQKKRLITLIALLWLLCLSSFAAGFVANQVFLVLRLSPSRWQPLQFAAAPVASDTGKADETFTPFDTLKMLWEVWSELQQNYVEEVKDQRKLTYGAIEGLLASLGDPYTRFMRPEEYKEFTSGKEGQLEGIGAMIGIRRDEKTGEEMLIIVEPLPGTPAQKAGLRPMDRVLKIEDKLTRGMTVEDAARLIRGEAGKPVTLTLQRAGVAYPFEVTITRARVEFPVVEHRFVAPGVGYVLLRTFSENAAEKLDRALDALERQGLKALIIDVRFNPGGLLTAALEVTSRFTNKDPLIYVQERNKQPRAYHPEPGVYRGYHFPIAVLVNEFSASGSEILAGALQDHGVAKVVGTPSFGKGMVQTVFKMEDGSAMAITTAKYLTPNKRDINVSKIKPDLQVDYSPWASLIEEHPLGLTSEQAETFLRLAEIISKGNDSQIASLGLSAKDRATVANLIARAVQPFISQWALTPQERDARDRQLQAAIALLKRQLAPAS